MQLLIGLNSSRGWYVSTRFDTRSPRRSRSSLYSILYAAVVGPNSRPHDMLGFGSRLSSASAQAGSGLLRPAQVWSG